MDEVIIADSFTFRVVWFLTLFTILPLYILSILFVTPRLDLNKPVPLKRTHSLQILLWISHSVIESLSPTSVHVRSFLKIPFPS